MDTLEAIKEKYELLSGILDERGRRMWAAVEARCQPHGGITLVSKATGLSRTTIHAGAKYRSRPAGLDSSEADASH
jgi:DNA-binding phage protein